MNGGTLWWFLLSGIKVSVLLAACLGGCILLRHASAQARANLIGAWQAAAIILFLCPKLPWFPAWEVTGKAAPLAAAFLPATAKADWVGWFFGLWLVGFLAVAIRFAIGVIRVQGLAMGSSDVSESDSIPEADGIPVKAHRNPALSALTFGFRRPQILIPQALLTSDRAFLRPILLHEVVHIVRGDWLRLMLSALSCGVFWWNPLAWWLHSRLVLDCEMACDEEVVKSGVSPDDYASALLDAARLVKQSAVKPALTMRSNRIEQRIKSVLDSRSLRRTSSLGFALPILVLGFVWTGDSQIDGYVANVRVIPSDDRIEYVLSPDRKIARRQAEAILSAHPKDTSRFRRAPSTIPAVGSF